MATADSTRGSKRDKRASKRTEQSHAFRNGCVVMLLLLLAAVYLAPMIIAGTTLRDQLAQRALRLDGTISIGAASLGWFSPVAVERIELRDKGGAVVIEVGAVRTAKTLVGLLLDFGNVGRVEVDGLSVFAVCREQVTNVEELFAEILREEGEGRVAAELVLTNGTLVVEDVPQRRTFRVEKLAVNCTLADDQQPIVLSAEGALHEGRQPAEFRVNLQTARSADGKNPLAGGKIDCQTTAVPLEIAGPVLRRVVEQGDLCGRLSSRLAGAWGTLAEGGDASVRGDAIITDLAFAAAALGSDRVQLDRVEIPCHLVQTGDTIRVEQLGIRSELGDLALEGSAKLDAFSAPDKLAALLREEYKLSGEVNLVEVARVLPATLRIREGTEITSGSVRLALVSSRADGQTAWSGQVGASRLGALADGKSLVWENPLDVDFAARETADGVVLEKAECTSSFLHANASGSLDNLQATANFDLSRLVAELKQFADLSQLELAGQGEARLAVERTADGAFVAQGQFEARGFQFVPIAGGEPWKEELVTARLDARGRVANSELARLDRATLSVEAGGERAFAQLREPIVQPAKSAWPVECTWRGDLAPWKPRLESCLNMTGWDLRGAGNVQAVVRWTPELVEIEHAKADFSQLQVWGHEWFVNEQSASLALEGKWNAHTRRAEVAEARLSAGTTSAVVRRATLQQGEAGWVVDGGTAQVAAELVTLYRWRHDPRLPAAWRVYGKLALDADFKHDASATSARLDGTIDGLKLIDATRPEAGTWEEPKMKLAAIAAYRPESGQVRVEKAQLVAAALECTASGTLPTSEQGGDVDLKGTLQYDWARLAPLWQPYTGGGVEITGRQARTFALRGRLTGSPALADSWRQVAGDAAVGWSGMHVYGFQVGPGDIAATLAGGQVTTRPIDVMVSEGRLTVSPIVQLSPGPAELFVARGPLLSDIHLTPEMCKRGLKFVAPIVAETTVAEGRFSVNMDGGRIPLADPQSGDLAGHMAIRAQVKPGPVAQEFMVLVNELLTVLRRGSFQPLNDQAGSLLSIDTSDIEFRMVNRRVYHRNLKFVIGTLPITTHGSVGMDESLSMVAEVPIRANLLGQDLSLGSLEGQSLQIPIGGTLKKPQLDRGVLRQLTGQVLQNVTRGVLKDELGKQIERLLPFQK